MTASDETLLVTEQLDRRHPGLCRIRGRAPVVVVEPVSADSPLRMADALVHFGGLRAHGRRFGVAVLLCDTRRDTPALFRRARLVRAMLGLLDAGGVLHVEGTASAGADRIDLRAVTDGAWELADQCGARIEVGVREPLDPSRLFMSAPEMWRAPRSAHPN